MNSSVRPFSLVHLDRVRFIWARTNTARMFKGIWQLFTLELSTKAKIGAKSVDCWHVQFSLLHWRKIIISIPVVTTVQICISKLLIGSFLIESRLSSSLSVFHSLHNYLSHFSCDNTTDVFWVSSLRHIVSRLPLAAGLQMALQKNYPHFCIHTQLDNIYYEQAHSKDMVAFFHYIICISLAMLVALFWWDDAWEAAPDLMTIWCRFTGESLKYRSKTELYLVDLS